MRSYAVFRVDDNDNRLDRVGEVTLDDRGMLALVQAEPAAEGDLREAIGEMNQSASLLKKVKPLAGAAKNAIRKEKHERGTPGFFDALQDNLRRWHAMELAEQ